MEEMEIITLNWKAPSERKIVDFVSKFDDETKRSFAVECLEKKKGVMTINKLKAKKWLVERFDATGEIRWENRPQVKPKKPSAISTAESWLNL